MTTIENTVAPESRRRRKVLAVLAGGTVLGVGAMVTLANWTDTNWADGIFGGGTYQIESATVNSDATGPGTFSTQNNQADDTLELVWDADTTNAYPGQEFESTWYVRVTEDTTYSGVVETLTYVGDDHDGFYVDYLAVDGYQLDGNGEPVDSAGDSVDVILPQGPDNEAGSYIEIDVVVTATTDEEDLAATIGSANHQTITWTLNTASVPD
ncbi:SipW-dependent-type signal peptide-containing protein [Nesterenkonia ebinurensis]|uniref:SipW-dependent-type signal peptide-containing protein n=1 Tax=Nesterenkonia ebinurensis TaxID=2608252 RepID=UPI00123DA7D2|nr:SipW-dependent-type signal peptide-containing protein [Nesterenkonia ebinurensis]